MIAAFSFLSADIDRQLEFYRSLLGWEEAEPSRSPIYRALRHGDLRLGFNALAAYRLLGIEDRQPAADAAPAPATAYPTFVLASPAAIDVAARRVGALGGQLVKPPFASYYGQWQTVLADPERNVVRLAAMSLPDGIEPAAPPF